MIDGFKSGIICGKGYVWYIDHLTPQKKINIGAFIPNNDFSSVSRQGKGRDINIAEAIEFG